MALETVSVVADQTWQLLSNAGAGRFAARVVDGTDVYFSIGATAPDADTTIGFPARELRFDNLDGKVWMKGAGVYAVVSVVRVVDAGNPAPVALKTTTLSATSFPAGSAPGTVIATINNRTPGSTFSIMPNDGRFAISDDGTTARIVAGLTATSASAAIAVTLTEAHPKAPNSPKKTAFSLSATSVVVVDQLRFVSALSRVGAKVDVLANAAHTEVAQTYAFLIGSGAVKSVAALVNNWAIPASGANAILAPGNAVTLLDVFLEYNGTLTRLTFGGSNTRALADAEFDVVSSEAVMALPLGASGLLHVRASVPAGGKVPQWNAAQDRFNASNVAKSYDATATTATLGLGGWTFTGTAPTTMARMPALVQLVGRFASGDPITVLGIGDSMFDGNFDANNTGFVGPRGQFSRAIFGAGGTDAIAGSNCSVNGGKPDPWFATTNAAAVTALLKYASAVAIGFMGLNIFPTAGAANNPSALTSIYNQFIAMVARLRSGASTAAGARTQRLLQLAQTPRITSASVTGSTTAGTSTALAPASQSVYGPQWDIGGDALALNTWLAGRVGVSGGVDAIFNADAIVRASTDPTSADYPKMKEGTVTDLVHFGGTTVAQVAAGLRSAILALAA